MLFSQKFLEQGGVNVPLIGIDRLKVRKTIFMVLNQNKKRLVVVLQGVVTYTKVKKSWSVVKGITLSFPREFVYLIS